MTFTQLIKRSVLTGNYNQMICKECGIDKPIASFYKNKSIKSGIMSKCKDCTKKNVAKRYKENKDRIKAYSRVYYKEHKDERKKQDDDYKDKIQKLKTKCLKCGESRLYVIDFHHIDPREKDFNIPRKTHKRDFSIIEKEASKCVSLCRNCHAEFHYLYGVIPQNPVEALNNYLRGDDNSER